MKLNYKRKTTCLAISFCIGMLASADIARGNLINNSSFEAPGPLDPTTFNGTGGGGLSAAADWFVFHNTNGSTQTEHMLYSEAALPPIFPGDPGAGGEHVLRVEASHAENGVVQVFGPLNTGPVAATGEAWVYVNSGVVGVGIGNGGSTNRNTFSTMTGRWEKLSFIESTSPVNEITLYASGGSAEFYIDLVSVNGVPEPSSAGLIGLAGSALFVVRRRKRCSN